MASVLRIPFGNNGVEEAPNAIIAQLSTLGLSEKGAATTYNIDAVEVYNDDLGMTGHNIQACLGHHNEGSDGGNGGNSGTIILGGSQFITVPCFFSFLRTHPNAGFVLLDAHPDCNPQYNLPGQQDVLLELIQHGVPASHILLVGTRSWTSEEKAFLSRHKIKCFFMKDLYEHGIQNLSDLVMERIREWPSFYLSIDMDVVDPAFAPGVDVAEPGGLSSREIIYLVQRLRCMTNFGMADLVEVNPRQDVREMTVKLAARLVKELLCQQHPIITDNSNTLLTDGW
ncbi:arginase family protein [Candidatus Woesearchaeota archaeon]|nr:arginase family protein [Candidatus Woesearchaeota archaeon]